MERVTYKSDEERLAHITARGIDLEDHCCIDMAWFISDPVETEHQGPNPVIMYSNAHREYRIDISHRGYRSTIIKFCPWCGTERPSSLNDTWYNTLYDMGYGDPGEDEDVPDEFDSDKWWKDRGL